MRIDDETLRRARRREAQVAAASLPLTGRLWPATPPRDPWWRAPLMWTVGIVLAMGAVVMFWVTWFLLWPMVLP